MSIQPVPLSARADPCRKSADYIALSSGELMFARRLAYDPTDEASQEGAFWAEYMEAEDDCMTARQVVPFDTFPLSVWHALISDMFEEPSDERDASQIDRLIDRRGLFPRDPASGPQQIALPSIELLTAFEAELRVATCPSIDIQLRVRTLDRLSGLEPDFYISPDALTTDGWNSLSVTMFEKTCTSKTGGQFETIFARPDLTTGTPLAHARAHLHELEAALEDPLQNDAAFDTYLSSLASSLLAFAPVLSMVCNSPEDAFSGTARFLDQHHPDWSRTVPRHDRFDALQPLPEDWSGAIDIVGLVQDDHARTPADLLGVAPELFGLYAIRHDGTSVWLGAAPTKADAETFVTQLG